MTTPWWQRITPTAQPLPPSTTAALSTVEATRWLDAVLRTETLPTRSARHYFQEILAEWGRASATPMAPAPEEPVKTPAVRVNEFGRTLTKPAAGAFAVGAVAGIAGWFDSAGSVLDVVSNVSLTAGVATACAAIGLRVATFADGRKYRRQLAARTVAAWHADQRRQRALIAPRALPQTPEGRLSVATANVAGEIVESASWGDTAFADNHFRIDVDRQVREIAHSCYEVHAFREQLGPPPGAVLHRDSEIRVAYQQRAQLLDERIDALSERVAQLVAYRDRLRELDSLVLKRQWFAQQGDDSRVYTHTALDQLAAADLKEAVAEVDSRTRAALEFLASDARRIANF